MWATIALTGAMSVITLVSSFTQDKESLRQALENGQQSASPASSNTPLSILGDLLLVGAFITLSLWMVAVHKNLVSRGQAQPLHWIWAWFGWFVPLANYVLPAIYMNGLNKRVRSWALWPWWIAWCAYWTVGWGFIFFLVGATYDAVSKNADKVVLTDSQLTTTVNLAHLLSALLVISFVFLAKLLKDINDRHLADTPENIAG